MEMKARRAIAIVARGDRRNEGILSNGSACEGEALVGLSSGRHVDVDIEEEHRIAKVK